MQLPEKTYCNKKVTQKLILFSLSYVDAGCGITQALIFAF
jgi:hypothetical protein